MAMNMQTPITESIFTALARTRSAPAYGGGFDRRWLAGDYWNDGKAEFNIYSGSVARYGEPRAGSRVIHILVRENFAPEALVKADDWRQQGAYPVLKLNQILHVPTGLYVYQQMHSAFWRVADGELVKATLTSNDSCGNSFKLIEAAGDQLRYEWDTYWQGMVAGDETIARPAGGVFYDELPALVRTIDFARGARSFEVPLAASIIGSRKDEIAFPMATVSVDPQSGDGTISVSVEHAAGSDEFLLAAEPPHLLLAWRRADGGMLELEHSLKVDYWNYNQPGDLERALDDQSLRLYP